MNKTLTFEHLRSTKGTHVYQEIPNAPSDELTVGTLYVRKTAFAQGHPAPTLTVTISSNE